MVREGVFGEGSIGLGPIGTYWFVWPWGRMVSPIFWGAMPLVIAAVTTGGDPPPLANIVCGNGATGDPPCEPATTTRGLAKAAEDGTTDTTGCEPIEAVVLRITVAAAEEAVEDEDWLTVVTALFTRPDADKAAVVAESKVLLTEVAVFITGTFAALVVAISPAEARAGVKQGLDMAVSGKFSLLVMVSVSSNTGPGTLVDATEVAVFSGDAAVWECFKTSLVRGAVAAFDLSVDDTVVTSTSMGCSASLWRLVHFGGDVTPGRL